MLRSGIRLLASLAVEVTESPLWDGDRRKLHFVDIKGCRILSLDWHSGQLSSLPVPEPVACISLAEGGHLVAGLKTGVALVRLHDGAITRLALIDEGDGKRLNDGRCDPAGRFFWVGSMVEALDNPGGHLYRVASDGTTERLVDGLICSNGLAWSPDGRTMYHADSRQRTVWAYDYEELTGRIGNRRVFAVAAEGEGRPDGAAVDREGCYWIARYDGWQIVRHAPDGREIFSFRTPVQNPTMCTFAGEDLSTLVFTSARGSLDAQALEHQPLAGSVFAVDLAVAGLPPPTFGAPLPEVARAVRPDPS